MLRLVYAAKRCLWQSFVGLVVHFPSSTPVAATCWLGMDEAEATTALEPSHGAVTEGHEAKDVVGGWLIEKKCTPSQILSILLCAAPTRCSGVLA